MNKLVDFLIHATIITGIFVGAYIIYQNFGPAFGIVTGTCAGYAAGCIAIGIEVMKD